IQAADESVSVLNLASDPYTVLVRIPDQELEQILASYTPTVQNSLENVITQMGAWLTGEVEEGLDAKQRQTLAETGMFDETPGSLPGLFGTREVNRQALGRYIRLYNAILKDKKSEHPDDEMRARREASGVILMIALENHGRCVD